MVFDGVDAIAPRELASDDKGLRSLGDRCGKDEKGADGCADFGLLWA